MRVQKDITGMLFINRTVMLIVAGNALEFFTGSGSVIQFSVDVSDFCRSFRLESNTRNKIYLGHDVLLIKEVNNVIRGTNLYETLTTI